MRKIGFAICSEPSEQFMYPKDITIQNRLGIFSTRGSTTDSLVISDFRESHIKPLFEIKNGVFIDVGSHIGKWSIYSAKILDNNGKVISIEPVIDNYNLLLKNIALNNIKNIYPLNMAASNQKGILYILEDVLSPDRSHISKKKPNQDIKTKINFYPVRVDTLDNIIKNMDITIGDVELIKLDVEGHELEVLGGAENLLRNAPNLRIIFEYINDSDHSFKDIYSYLIKFNYYIIKLDKLNYLALKGVSNDKIRER